MNEYEDFDMVFKIVLIGDSAVGKSNILNRYTKDQFTLNTKSTVGVEFGAKTVTLKDQIIKAQIWDTAGQERYKSVTNAYYKNAKGGFIVYDITRRSSFEQVENWLTEFKNVAGDDVFVTLIGNKTDLRQLRAVDKEEAINRANDLGIGYIETSALNNTHFNEAFHNLTMSILF